MAIHISSFGIEERLDLCPIAIQELYEPTARFHEECLQTVMSIHGNRQGSEMLVTESTHAQYSTIFRTIFISLKSVNLVK